MIKEKSIKIGIRPPHSNKTSFIWPELETQILSIDKDLIPYYKELFEYARLLSLSEPFTKTLNNIITRFAWKSVNWNDNKEDKKISDFAVKGSKEILRKFDIEPQWNYLIKDLVLLGYFAPGDDIYYSYYGWYVDEGKFTLELYHPVTKNQFHKFIDSNWKHLNKDIAKLPKISKINLTERDCRILELRDEGKLKFSEIADKIEREFKIDNEQGSINEDSIKVAYKRAKDKVLSIVRKR
jgi:hypothetical protein